MLAIDVKRGVEATLERVFQNTGRRFDKLNVRWSGKTAGIAFERNNDKLIANVVFPAVDETKEIDRDLFNQLIGYALHELGHAWFTDNQPWDDARIVHGAFVSGLINGLEDPRIEQCVIDSGYAPNSRALFENLINQVLIKSGHVDGDDIANIPFLLAVEGRRLNGYSICLPNPIDTSPYAEHLHWALSEARKAADTARVVEVAIELYERLQHEFDQPEDHPEDQPEDQPEGQPEDQPDPTNPGDDGGDDGGDGGDQGGDQPGGDDGDEGDQGGQPGGDDKPSDRPGNKPTDKRSKSGKNKGKFPDEPDRDVEPTSHINDELEGSKCDADSRIPRPDVGKPFVRPITFDEE